MVIINFRYIEQLMNDKLKDKLDLTLVKPVEPKP
jgi:hypothetical protein